VLCGMWFSAGQCGLSSKEKTERGTSRSLLMFTRRKRPAYTDQHVSSYLLRQLFHLFIMSVIEMPTSAGIAPSLRPFDLPSTLREV
jgi:hypothetical protein